MRPVHTSHLFGIIKDRMAQQVSNLRDKRPLILEPETFTSAQTIAITATFKDPHDGQRYRLALCPEDVDTQFVRTMADGTKKVIAPTIFAKATPKTYAPRRPSATDPAARIKPSGRLAGNVIDLTKIMAGAKS